MWIRDITLISFFVISLTHLAFTNDAKINATKIYERCIFTSQTQTLTHMNKPQLKAKKKTDRDDRQRAGNEAENNVQLTTIMVESLCVYPLFQKK